MGLGYGDDGLCEELLMGGWRVGYRNGLELGQLGISPILLLFFEWGTRISWNGSGLIYANMRDYAIAFFSTMRRDEHGIRTYTAPVYGGRGFDGSVVDWSILT